MDQLWAPWRHAYLEVPAKPGVRDGCFICRSIAETNDRDHLLVTRREHCVVMLNRYPYNNGHLLIAPKAHKGHLRELGGDEIMESQQLLTEMMGYLDEFMHPEGYNIGLNLGKAAGAGLPGHVHWHIVPRWSGDTNFMPIFTDVRVIVQSLEAFYDQLLGKIKAHRFRPEINELGAGAAY